MTVESSLKVTSDPRARAGRRGTILFVSVVPVWLPLEVTSDIFPLADVCQQLIESCRCASEGLQVRVLGGFQHLIETARRRFELLEFFTRDLLLASLLGRLHQAHDSFPDIAFPTLIVVVVHGPTAT